MTRARSHVAAEAPERQNRRPIEPSGPRLPEDLRRQLRRLLAQILVADVRMYPVVPQDVIEPTVKSTYQRNRGPEDEP